MNTTGKKAVLFSIIVAAFAAILLVSLLGPQTGYQHVFSYKQTDANSKTLYMHWPVVFGVARIPLYTTQLISRNSKQE